MNTSRISMIAAVGRNRELGAANKLLWKIPEDTHYFRDTTRGHVVVMGRKTYESIGHPLPGRVNIVITRNPFAFEKEHPELVEHFIVDTVSTALEVAQKKEQVGEVFVIGGGEIYKQALSSADRLYLTLIDAIFPEADAFFPEYPQFTKVVSKRDSEGNGYKYSFVVLEKD